MASQQWLFHHSSPILPGVITRVVIAEPHSHQVIPPAAPQPTVVPTILRTFTCCGDRENQNDGDFAEPEESTGADSADPSGSSGTSTAPSTSGPEQTNPGQSSRLMISQRKRHKFRDSVGNYSWFESHGDSPIRCPPAIIKDVENGNIFFYWIRIVDKCQMWIWCASEERHEWVSVQEGHQIEQGGLVRYLVVTDRHQPSFVLQTTWDKYKRKAVCWGTFNN